MTGAQVFEGLSGVLVARTELSLVDGEQGRLLVRGQPIEGLAARVPFEAMVGLLLDGALPDSSGRAEHARRLGLARVTAHARLERSFDALFSPSAMSTLRSALSVMDPDATAHELLGMAAVATAAWVRRQRGGELLAPRAELEHARDLLRLMGTPDVSQPAAELLDAYLVTVAEHGFNASTFAARVVASTGADLGAACVAGLAALSGPLHGGAPGPVLDMLDAVGSPERAGDFVRAELAAGRRIMGMGHRIYRVRDPRALVLERALQRYQAQGAANARLLLARAVERAALSELAQKYPERALQANVEFYTALVLEALDVPRAAFSAVFGCARCAGYAAHYAEERKQGRLIRPSALYVGKL